MLLFCYGTLCIPEVFKRVTSQDLNSYDPIAAQLLNYEARYVKGESYPGLFYKKAMILEGKLIEVDSLLLDKIWIYEGEDDYDLVEVMLHSPQLKGYCFFPKKELSLEDKTWDLKSWQEENDLNQFLAQINLWCP